MRPPGPFWAFGAPRAPPEAPGDSGEAPGAPRRLREHFWDTPDFGLPASSRRPACRRLPEAWRRPLEAWRRPALGILADELARFCDMAGFFEAWRRLWPDFSRPGGLAAAAAGLAAAPSFCCSASGLPRRGAFSLQQQAPSKKRRAGTPQPLLSGKWLAPQGRFFPPKRTCFGKNDMYLKKNRCSGKPLQAPGPL